MNDNPDNVLFSCNRLLVLAPHPDDESLGCGGTIAQCIRMGKDVCVVVISKGDAVNVKIDNIVDVRKEESRKACEILGVKKLSFLDFPDTALNKYHDEIKRRIGDVIRTYDPDIVFSPSPMDGHDDHVAVSKIAISLLKELSSFKVAFYEVYSPIRYNCIIDITDTMDIKERAILCYHYGLLEKPEQMLNAISGLNAYRSFAFLKKGFFEAFCVVTANEGEDEMINWLTYGLSKEASSYRFLSGFKKADQLLTEYQNSLKKINELNELLREKDRKVGLSGSKYGTAGDRDMPGIAHAFYKIRDIFFPHNTRRRRLYDTVVKKIKQ